MITETDLRAGPVTLIAPIHGMVRLSSPRMLCGELEVFRSNETIATITGREGIERVAAPANGFVLRVLVADGVRVEAGAPLVVFSIVG